MTDLPRITADFSNLAEDDLVFARAERASQPLGEGDQVLVVDGEGNECRGRVARLEGGMVYLDLSWDTWGEEGVSTGVSQHASSVVQGKVVLHDEEAVLVEGGSGSSRPERRQIHLVPSA